MIRSRISDRLLALVDGGSSGVVELQVVLQSDIPPERIDQIATQLARHGSARALATLGIITLTASPATAGPVSEIEGVSWVDLQSETSLDELMD